MHLCYASQICQSKQIISLRPHNFQICVNTHTSTVTADSPICGLMLIMLNKQQCLKKINHNLRPMFWHGLVGRLFKDIFNWYLTHFSEQSCGMVGNLYTYSFISIECVIFCCIGQTCFMLFQYDNLQSNYGMNCNCIYFIVAKIHFSKGSCLYLHWSIWRHLPATPSLTFVFSMSWLVDTFNSSTRHAFSCL